MAVAHQGRLQSFKAENSLICCALPGSLAEVMEFSISRGSVLVCGCMIPKGCRGCGSATNPPDIWKILLHSLCVTVTARIPTCFSAAPEVWGILWDFYLFLHFNNMLQFHIIAFERCRCYSEKWTSIKHLCILIELITSVDCVVQEEIIFLWLKLVVNTCLRIFVTGGQWQSPKKI